MKGPLLAPVLGDSALSWGRWPLDEPNSTWGKERGGGEEVFTQLYSRAIWEYLSWIREV